MSLTCLLMFQETRHGQIWSHGPSVCTHVSPEPSYLLPQETETNSLIELLDWKILGEVSRNASPGFPERRQIPGQVTTTNEGGKGVHV